MPFCQSLGSVESASNQTQTLKLQRQRRRTSSMSGLVVFLLQFILNQDVNRIVPSNLLCCFDGCSVRRQAAISGTNAAISHDDVRTTPAKYGYIHPLPHRQHNLRPLVIVDINSTFGPTPTLPDDHYYASVCPWLATAAYNLSDPWDCVTLGLPSHGANVPGEPTGIAGRRWRHDKGKDAFRSSTEKRKGRASLEMKLLFHVLLFRSNGVLLS